jgi:hypothetical protein
MGIASFGDSLSSIPEGNFAFSSGENIGGIFIGA